MAAIHHYREAVGAADPFDVEMEASIRAGELGLAVDAVLGSAATSGVIVDDSDGTVTILGKQCWEVDEDEAPAEITLTGTVEKTASDTTLEGTGTAFLTELAEGDEVIVPGGGGTEYVFVKTITDDDHAELWVAPVHSASGQTATVAGRQRMWSGRTGRRVQRRGLDRAEGGEIHAAGRSISIDLIERNGLLHSRIPVTGGEDSSDNWNRPAETLAVRLAFIVGSDIFADLEIFDDGFVDYPTFDLDKDDLRGRFLDEILNEIAQTSNQDLAVPHKRNIGIFYHEAAGHWALWFQTLEAFAYPSPVRITNDESDLASPAANMYPSSDTPEAEWEQDPEGMASRVVITLARSRVVRENATLEDTIGPWDVAAPNSSLKTVAAAQAYGDAELAQSDTEDTTWTGRILLPAAKVNDVREFQQCRLRQTHQDGLQAERWMRVVHRDIKEALANGKPAPWLYDVGLILTPADFPPGSIVQSAFQYGYADGIQPMTLPDDIAPGNHLVFLANRWKGNTNNPSPPYVGASFDELGGSGAWTNLLGAGTFVRTAASGDRSVLGAWAKDATDAQKSGPVLSAFTWGALYEIEGYTTVGATIVSADVPGSSNDLDAGSLGSPGAGEICLYIAAQYKGDGDMAWSPSGWTTDQEYTHIYFSSQRPHWVGHRIGTGAAIEAEIGSSAVANWAGIGIRLVQV